jgi:hypothetical protein
MVTPARLTKQKLGSAAATTASMTEHGRWIRPILDEIRLKELGLHYETRLVQIAEINFLASKAMQPRFDEYLIEDLVERYALSMKNGDRFPASVLWMIDNAYVILSGNNRIQAAIRCEDKEILAYVVLTASTERAELFAKTANASNGLPPSHLAVLENGVELVRKHGFSQAEVSRWLGCRPQALSRRLKAEDKRDSLIKNKFPEAKNLPVCSLLVLDAIKNRDVCKKAAEMAVQVKEGHLPRKIFEEAVQAAADQETIHDSLEVLDRYRESVPTSGARPVGRNTKRAVLQDKLLSLKNTLANYRTPQEFGIHTEDELRQVTPLLQWIVKRIETVFLQEACT